MRVSVLYVLAVVGSSAASADVGLPVILLREANACRFAGALAVADTMSTSVYGERMIAITRARLLLQLERFKDAEALLERWKSSGSQAEQAEANLLLGLVQARTAKEDVALATLESARRLGADPVLVEGAKAVAALEHHDFELAEAKLLSALRAAPELTGALYNLACLRAEQGRIAESASLVRQAWYIGLRNVEMLKHDPSLEALRLKRALISDLLEEKQSVCLTW
jgi:tetratricopeptide (TPR) repeat protein